MPHDKNGELLQVGDLVTIEAEVKSVQPSDEFCNITVMTVEKMPPYPEGTSITLNTKQCVKTGQAKAPEAG